MDEVTEVVTETTPAPDAPQHPAVPESVETASTEAAPVSGEETPEPEPSKPAKTFTQEEVDALIAKRLARAERKRLAEQRQPEPKAEPQPEPVGKPDPSKFNDTESYLEALTEWKADQKVTEKLEALDKKRREEHVKAAQQQAQAQYQALEEKARDTHEDFDDVVYNPAVPITDHMAFTIQNSEVGPELAYYLGTHLSEAARISRLHPLAQAKELGKLEDKLSAPAPRPAKPSNAPEPIKPIGGKGSASQSFDTTDPRSTKTMTTSEWIAAERKRQEARWKAQHAN